MTYRSVTERVCDYNPVELPLPPEVLIEELRRCQDCGVPFCHAAGCPLGNNIPEINAEALSGRWRSALANLLSTSPFPEFTCRVCPALCEGSCVQGLNEKAISCRMIEYEVIERGFASGLMRPQFPKSRLGLRATVIGSGPAGLACAWRLNQAGAEVTVYERDAKPGGFLRYGIPDFKLEKMVIDRRIDLMEQEGIKFECGVEAGVDISEKLLRRRYDVLILAIGARKKRDLNIPGRDLKGIHLATDFLSAQNRTLSGESSCLAPEYNCRGKKVVVIGGGDTGSDCVGTAIRLGAGEVFQFEIMPKPPENRADDNPWPHYPRILKTTTSHEEGCQRAWNIDTLEFMPSPDDPESLGALRCREVIWQENGGNRFSPEPRPQSEFIQAADMVFLAMGFVGVEDLSLLKDLGLIPNKSGPLSCGSSYCLGDEIYSCGDAVTGPSLAVKAIAGGLAAAEAVLNR